MKAELQSLGPSVDTSWNHCNSLISVQGGVSFGKITCSKGVISISHDRTTISYWVVLCDIWCPHIIFNSDLIMQKRTVGDKMPGLKVSKSSECMTFSLGNMCPCSNQNFFGSVESLPFPPEKRPQQLRATLLLGCSKYFTRPPRSTKLWDLWCFFGSNKRKPNHTDNGRGRLRDKEEAKKLTEKVPKWRKALLLAQEMTMVFVGV